MVFLPFIFRLGWMLRHRGILTITNAKHEEQNRKWSSTKGNKIRIFCFAATFSGAQKRADMLRQPYSLGGPQCQARGAQWEMASSPMPSRGPKRGRQCCVTPAFSGIPNAKHEVQNQKWSPTKGKKITSGCLNSAVSGARKRAEMLCQSSVLGDPKWQAQGAKSEVATSPLPSQGPKRVRKCYVCRAFSGIPNAKHGVRNVKSLPEPCLLGVPKEGGNATSPQNYARLPTPSAGSKIKSGTQQRGTKSEMVHSPLPSLGQKEGRKCDVSPT